MLNYFKDRFFRNTFLIYMSVFAILLLVLCLVFGYQEAARRREKEFKEAQASAQLMAQSIDDRFSTIEMVATYIDSARWSPYLSSESDILNSKLDYLDMKEIHKELGVFNDVLRIARSTAILLPRRDLAVDRVDFRRIDNYFQWVGLDPEFLGTIQEQLKDNYSSQVLLSPRSGEEGSWDFCILRQIDYDTASRMILFVLVDAKQFDKFIGSNLVYSRKFQICQDDQVVYSYEREDAPEGDLLDIAIPSSLYQWSYLFSVRMSPNSEIFQNLSIVVLGLILYAAAVVFLAYLLCRLTYRPVAVLMERLGMNVREQFWGLREVENVFVSMRNQKEGMEELANQYYRLGQDSFYASLLNGTFDEENVDEYVQKFHTELKQDMSYQVMAFSGIRPDSGEYKEFAEYVLKLQVECYREGIIVLTSFMEGCMLLIMAAEGGEQKLAEQTERVRKTAGEWSVASELRLFAGGVHEGFKGIHRSYQEVKESMRGDRLEENRSVYYYPFDMELKLIKSLRGGSFAEVEQVIREVKEENCRRAIPAEMEYKVTGVIYETLYRYALEFELEWKGSVSECQRLIDAGDLEGLWGLVMLRLREIEEAYHNRNRFVTVGGRLVRYVEEHFSSSSLSQQEIADHFGISRPMVSKIFKETVNMNFVDYLQLLRVEAAKKYIDGGDYDMIRVARQCGYENESTFRRVFVKYVGVTPQKYINMKKM